jgi:hypothetical protein
MCNAFAGFVTKSQRVVWRAGMDSHDELYSAFVETVPELRDDVVRELLAARFEITPVNGDYLNPEGEWIFRLDERNAPIWWADQHEAAAWRALEQWKAAVYTLINLDEARNPITPLAMTPPEISAAPIAMLRELAGVLTSVGDSVGTSVRDSVLTSVGDNVLTSVRDSVCDSVWTSVRDSVCDSLWDSVRDSAWDSLWDSVWAYIGSLFDVWDGPYRYQSRANLWRMGLVPVCDDGHWQLVGGPNAKVLYTLEN